MNQFQEQYYQMMTRLGRGSRQEAKEWSLDKNGVIVSKPIESSKSASVVTQQSISLNKVKTIADFINTN